MAIPHIALDKVADWPSQVLEDNFPSYRRSLTIVNNLPTDLGLVRIASRDGLKFDLKPKFNPHSRDLIVRVDITVDNEVRDSIMERMNTKDMENSPVLAMAEKQWSLVQAVGKVVGYSKNVIRVEYPISMDLLKRSGGIVYIKDLDLVVALKQASETKEMEHPYSHGGQILGVADGMVSDVLAADGEEAVKSSVRGAIFIRTIKIIDNAGAIGKRWTRIGQEIFLIEPQCIPDTVDGIYVLHSQAVQSAQENNGHLVAERYDPDDMIPYFKLHKSYVEALNDEVSVEVRNAELKQAEFEARKSEAETKLKKAELDLERANTERDVLNTTIDSNRQKFEHEKDLLERKVEELREERENAKIKEAHEKSSVKRKSFLELLKSLPVVITGVLTLVVTFLRLMKTRPT